MVKQVTTSNTKAQILAAYKEALAELAAKEKEIKALQKGAGAAAPAPAAAAPAPKAAPAAGAPRTVSDVVNNLEGLAGGFGQAVNALSATLTTEATRLADLRNEITAITSGLNELHGIEVGDGTLQKLLTDLQARTEAFEQEQDTKQEAYDQEMAEKQEAWKKERLERAARIKERDEELRKTRKREAEEFKYDLSLFRKRAEDEYALSQKALQTQLDELREKTNKEFEAREAALKERENAFAEARTKVAAMPDELDGALKKAREEGTNIAKRQARINADLLAKEHEGRKRVYELRIETMETTISKQNAQITNLSTQLSAALKQAQDLAVKAIEGASNATSFDAIREIAMEQAKNPQKSK